MFDVLMVALVANSFTPEGLGVLLAQPQSWGLLLGVVTPLAVAVLKQPGLPARAKPAVAVVAALVVGAATVASTGSFNGGDFFGTAALVLAASEVAYRKLWKPNGVAQRVEDATNVGSRRERRGERESHDPDVIS